MARLSDFHQNYWNAFQAIVQTDGAGLPQPHPSYSYMIFPPGVEGSHLAASVLVSRKLVTFYLLLEGNHRNAMFCHLYSWKTEIDEELHETPYWTVSKSSNRARITVELRVDDFGDHKDWPRQHGWIIDNARSFYRAFRPRLHELKATP